MHQELVIDIRDLVVVYSKLRAVDGLSLSVRRGEIFGLLGPNGAGKSSTLATIEGLRRADGGSVVVAGYDMSRDDRAVRPLLGVQLQTTALFPDLCVAELVEVYAALYESFPGPEERNRLLEQFGLRQKASARAEQLSGGQKQRLALALATINNPQLVLLDEPTTGLDPQARRGVWALIRRMKAEGRTVVLTTHAMEEAQELCDRVGIIEAGKLVALGTPAELIRRHAPPLSPQEAARRQPNLEDVFLALTGRNLGSQPEADAIDEEAAWLAAQ